MRCYLCRKSTAEFFLKAKGRYQIRCATCGLVYSKLEKDKIFFNDIKFLKEYALEEDLFQKYFKDILSIIKGFKKTGSLLDIGCGMGTFLALAKQDGWKTKGIDSSPAATQYTRSIGLDVNNERIEKTRLKSESFDVITAFQALEHFTNPIGVLRSIHRALKPKGYLVLTTPNRSSTLGKLMGKRWFGYYNREHLFIFDQHSLGLLAYKTGYKIIQLSEKQGRPLSLPWILTRLADYYYDHRSWARRLIKSLLPVSRSLDSLNIKEPKVDLLLIAQKN